LPTGVAAIAALAIMTNVADEEKAVKSLQVGASVQE